MSRSTIGKLAKIVVSLGLLAAILVQVGPRDVVAQIGSMDVGLVALAFLLLLSESLVRALNWFQLIRSGSRKVTLRTVTYAHFVGGFFGALLPSTLGTDVARSAVVATRSRVPVESYLATTVLLNVLSLAVISAAALVAGVLVLDWPEAPVPLIAIAAAVSCTLLLGITVAWFRATRVRSSRSAPGSATAGLRAPLKRRFAEFVTALKILPRGLRIVNVACVAAVSYGLRSLGWLVLLVAADVQISWAALLTIGPLVTLGAALPISVLGFGGFQAISVYLLAQWGVPLTHALAASLVQSGLAVLLHSVGCAMYIAGDAVSRPALGAVDAANEEYSG